MAIRRKYANPPIQEALCELSLSGVTWDKRAVEAFFSQIRSRYDGLPYASAAPEALFEATGEDDLPVPGVLIMLTADGTRIVRAAAHQLAILTTAPYLGWEEYEERIREALDGFDGVFNTAKVTKVRIVYDNSFVVPTATPEDDFLTIVPAEIDPESPRFYFNRGRLYEEKIELDTYVSRFSFHGGKQKAISFGIEVASDRLDVGLKDALNVLKGLKSVVTEQFELGITDHARALFGVDE